MKRQKENVSKMNTPEEILERWTAYVNNVEVDRVVNLYDDKSTIFPTFSSHCISESREITAYFRQLSEKKSMSVELHPETLRKVELGDNIFLMTGLYTFHLIADDAQDAVPSRFTYVIDIKREKPIIHHHSSSIPRIPS